MPPILTVKVEKDGREIKINADQTIEYAAQGWTRVVQPTVEDKVAEAEHAEQLAKEQAEAEAEAKEAEEKNRQVEAENQARAKLLEEAKAAETPVEDATVKELVEQPVTNEEPKVELKTLEIKTKDETESKKDTLVVD